MHLQSEIEVLPILLIVFSGQGRHVVWLNGYSFSTHGEHVIPSPENPVLQVQLKLPGVFVQFALTLHPPLFIEHSSISIYSLLNYWFFFFFFFFD